MNLFLLHRNIDESVKMYADVHVRKIVIEALQMLNIACAYNGGYIQDTVDPYGKRTYTVFNQMPGVYKYTKSQASHPVTVWVRANRANASYTYFYVRSLAKEYQHRFGKPVGGRILDILRHCEKNLADTTNNKNLPYAAKTSKFYQDMPEEFRGSNAVSAYRWYYAAEKAHLCVWTRRPVPSFMKEAMACLQK